MNAVDVEDCIKCGGNKIDREETCHVCAGRGYVLKSRFQKGYIPLARPRTPEEWYGDGKNNVGRSDKD